MDRGKLQQVRTEGSEEQKGQSSKLENNWQRKNKKISK